MYSESCFKFLKQLISLECHIPIGALITYNNQIIIYAVNTYLEHAEEIVIKYCLLNNYKLSQCEIYITLEPCPKCGYIILENNLKNVYFGSWNYNHGVFGGKFYLHKLLNINFNNYYGGIMAYDFKERLDRFFLTKR